MMKNFVGKSYNKIFNSLKGSGLSKYNNVRKIHRFATQQFKSEFVDVYGFKFYLGPKMEYSLQGIFIKIVILIC